MKPKDYVQLMIDECKRLKKKVVHEPCGELEYQATRQFYRNLYYLFNKKTQ